MDQRQKKLYPQVEQEFSSEGYPILKLMPRKSTMFRPERRRTTRVERRYDLRETKMPDNIDWPSVWPVAKTFTPSAVPLPMRQSYEKKGGPPLFKYANTELIKISNFLHIGPVAVRRHCKALKKFCTSWPEGLDSDEQVRSHFPVTVITKDYVHSAPTIRDPRARVVQLQVHIDDLKLPKQIDKDKLICLARHRYDSNTGMITITTDACPMKQQNHDYAEYLLTALYFESIKHEDWENEREESDWERFYWDRSESKTKVSTYKSPSIDDQAIEHYKQSLERVYEVENKENLEAYRSSVERLLGLSAAEAETPQPTKAKPS